MTVAETSRPAASAEFVLTPATIQSANILTADDPHVLRAHLAISFDASDIDTGGVDTFVTWELHKIDSIADVMRVAGVGAWHRLESGDGAEIQVITRTPRERWGDSFPIIGLASKDFVPMIGWSQCPPYNHLGNVFMFPQVGGEDGWAAWPKDQPPRYNGSGEPCDMWTGPCLCGAMHRKGK